MTLEEAEKKLTIKYKTMTNTVGNIQLDITVDTSDAGEKIYTLLFCKIHLPESVAFDGGPLGSYSSPADVKNSFIGLSYAPDIDPNGWTVSTFCA